MKTLVSLVLIMACSHAFAQGDIPSPREEVRLKIRASLMDFQKCYEDKFKGGGSRPAKVVLDWDIDDAGKVTRATVKSTELNSPDTEKCLVDRLKSMSFPPAPKSQVMNISYPFVFSSSKKK